MNTTVVQIHIFPQIIDLGKINEYTVEKFGKVFSNTNEIKVNKTINGYSVLYRDNVFKNLDTVKFGENIIKLFMNNIPGVIELDINYYPMSKFDEEVGVSIIHLNKYFSEIDIPNFNYYISDLLDDLLDLYDEANDVFRFGEEDDEDEDEDDDLETEDPFAFLQESLDGYGSPKNKNKKSKKKSYGSSRIVKAAKNPKRDIRRHGVVVCNEKSIIRKDERIIKEFLEDFLPGNSDWRKQFRKQVLKRWISMYSITKKNLKHLEKDHHHNQRSKTMLGGIDKETAMNFTRRLFTPSDTWNDPNR